MDSMATFLLVVSLIWVAIHILLSNRNRTKSATSRRLPPGPYPLPIIGNLLQLGNQPHKSLQRLSETYGPLMYLKLGSRTTIVVSSPRTAQQVLQKHDIACSGRSVPDSATALDNHKVSMPWLPVGSKWRTYRKICKEEMFTVQQLNVSQDLRRRKVKELVDYVSECCKSGEAIDIGGAVFTTSLNMMSNTFFSIDFAHHSANLSQELKEIVSGLLEVLGKPNLADFFPVLSLVDPQGLRRKSQFCFQKIQSLFDVFIDQRLESRKANRNTPTNSDLLEALLNYCENDTEFASKDMNQLLIDLFVAGTDTTSVTVEWAMTELLKNPEKLAKARIELEHVIGKNGVVQESDISRLPYLQAVVKETFRMHPALPMLPHKAEDDVEIDGFVVPKNAQILVNVWAIGRDSSSWENPCSFEPERFLEGEIEFRGRHFELIPFGAGRRMCPGLPLAHRMVHLMLVSLIHSFNWKLEGGMKPEDMDLSEKFGAALQKAMPLKAIPVKQ